MFCFQGFVLKKDKKKEDKEDQITIEELIEKEVSTERVYRDGGDPYTYYLFLYSYEQIPPYRFLYFYIEHSYLSLHSPVCTVHIYLLYEI